jgi:GTP cyclohydrolase I
MDAIVHPLNPNGFIKRDIMGESRPSRAEVESAVRTLIRWTGDDPNRDGLIETPSRVARAYQDLFSGYAEDAAAFLRKTFDETDGYDEMIAMRGIRFESHCEHHMAPIIGHAWVAYLPTERVVGISKLARVVEIYAKRLQIQERLTSQVANTIDEVLKPKGVAVLIKAQHLCVGMRGIRKHEADLVTTRMLGCFRDDPALRKEFLALVG